MTVAECADYRLVGIDDFIANLWRVHLEVKQEGYAQVNPPVPAATASLS